MRSSEVEIKKSKALSVVVNLRIKIKEDGMRGTCGLYEREAEYLEAYGGNP